jgi:hypothetical protein
MIKIFKVKFNFTIFFGFHMTLKNVINYGGN